MNNTKLGNKYTLVNKQFLKTLLKTHIHPCKYITKKLTPEEQNLHNLIVDLINEQLTTSTDWLTRKRLQELSVASVKRRQEIFQGLEDQLHEIANNKAEDVETIITDFYNTGAMQGYKDIQRSIVFTAADEKALFYINQYSFDQIRGLSNDLTSQIRTEIWRGVGEGASMPKITNRLLELDIEPLNVNGRILSPRTRAEMIARTETARARNTGSLQSYANYGIEYGELITARDDRVCEDCLDIEDNNPHTLTELSNIAPVHPNCRCAVAPVTGINVNRDVDDNPVVIDTTTDNQESVNRVDDLK